MSDREGASPVASIAEARAKKAGDCREWSSLDMAEALVRDIKAGLIRPDQIVVHWFERESDGGRTHRQMGAGVTFPEHIALLNVALRRVLADWEAR